ncbi:MAG TPA: ABC transporter permease [Acidimicrobiales bacterium]|nr:ABC transporter permease [Acidimicrobiales bacterium]
MTDTVRDPEPQAAVAEPSVALLEVESLESQLAEKPESFGKQARGRFFRNKLAIFGIVVLTFMIVLAIVGPWLRPFGFEERNVTARLQSPNATHWFGTDNIGRDLFVRATRGARTSLLIAFVTAVVAVSFGVVMGAVAGYYGRWVDSIISFVTNLFITIPFLAILLVFGIKYGAEPLTISLMIALFIWTRAARIVRGTFLALSQQEFVQAARAAGARGPRIIFRHILPHSVGPIVVEFTLTAGVAIILESTLSFLGLGILPPETSLGALVAQNKGQFTQVPTAVLLPGLMITFIILSLNFIGDGLRDAFDPKSGIE